MLARSRPMPKRRCRGASAQIMGAEALRLLSLDEFGGVFH